MSDEEKLDPIPWEQLRQIAQQIAEEDEEVLREEHRLTIKKAARRLDARAIADERRLFAIRLKGL